MAISNSEAKELLDQGIHLDEFDRVVRLLRDDDDYELTGDSAADFKAGILRLNEAKALPEDLSSWCDRYGLEWNRPELILPDPDPIEL